MRTETTELDSNLQAYTDSSIQVMSPIKKQSQDLQDEAEKLEIKDSETLKVAVELRKKVVKHINSTDAYRKEYTRPLDKVTEQLIAGQREVLAPAEEAKTVVGQKIMRYEEEQERLEGIERERVQQIISGFTTGEAVHSNKVTAIDERGKAIKATYAALTEADQQHPDIKLAFTQAVNRLLEARDILSRAQVDEAERAKAQAERDAAELKAKHEAETAPQATAAPKPKTGSKTVTKFAVEDESAVPRQYLVVNESAIREAIRAGATEIPGVRIYQERSF